LPTARSAASRAALSRMGITTLGRRSLVMEPPFQYF
jgi:hypothetical protein